jgi:hypothetical protein
LVPSGVPDRWAVLAGVRAQRARHIPLVTEGMVNSVETTLHASPGRADEIHSLITSELKPGGGWSRTGWRPARRLRNPVRAIRLPVDRAGRGPAAPRCGVTSVDVDDISGPACGRCSGFTQPRLGRAAHPRRRQAIRHWIRRAACDRAGASLRSASATGHSTSDQRVAGNRYLVEVRPLRNRTELVFSLLIEQRGRIVVEHDEIVTAIDAGDRSYAGRERPPGGCAELAQRPAGDKLAVAE